MKKEKRNPYLEITQTIIERLKKGVIPWRSGFANCQYGMPKNYCSGHHYKGINRLLMSFLPYEYPFYLSFLQCQQLGGRIRKGAKSHKVYYSSFAYFDAEGRKINQEQFELLESVGIKGIRKVFFLRTYRVFNVADVEGIQLDLPERPVFNNTGISYCEDLIQSLQPDLDVRHENNNEAYYQPVADFINVPSLYCFYSSDHYYATLFHEIGHWTGHKSRLARSFDSFGTAQYSKEELIAELTAAFLCGNRGILNEPLKEASAAYIQSWIKVLQNDEQLIYQAAQKAQKATDFILEYPQQIQLANAS